MTIELEKYIKDALANGDSLVAITRELEKVGWDEQSIDAALKKAMSGHNAPAPKHDHSDETPPEGPHHRQFNLTTALTIVGSILIIAALASVISSTWKDVSATTRILYLLLPMLGLYAISYFSSKNEELGLVGKITQFAAAFMFPFVVGTFLYQTKLVTKIEAPLFIWSTSITLAFYLLMEFVAKISLYAVLSAVMTYSVSFSILAKYRANEASSMWTIAGISLIFLLIGNILIKSKKEDPQTFFRIGAFTTTVSLPAAVTISLTESNRLSYDNASLVQMVFVIIFLICASRLYKKYVETKNQSVYVVKRFLEEYSAILLFAALISYNLDAGPLSVIAVVLGTIYILVSIRIKIKVMPWIGIIGLFFGMIAVSNEYFENSFGWPFAVFLSGFAAIGLGLYAKKKAKDDQGKKPVAPLWGLGQDQEAEKKRPRSLISDFFVGLLIFFIVINILGYIASFAFSQRYHSDPMDTNKID